MLRNRWLAVVAAVAFIGVAVTLIDISFDALLGFPWKTLVVTSAISVVVAAAAWLAIGRIDRLGRDLVERNEALESRNAVLRAVYEVSLSVAGQADPEHTIAVIVDHARNLLRVDAAILALDTPRGLLRLRAASAANGILEPRKAGETPPDYDQLDCFLLPGYDIRASAPVKHGDKRIGTLAIAGASSSTRQPLESTEMDTLSALATQVGLAIEAARIQDELQELAVQRERERIARDMHDGLAQVLAYVNTKSQAVSQLLADGRIEEARTQLAELSAAARAVFIDVREAILNLSGTGASDRGVTRALEEYVTLFAESSDLAVRFRATPEAASAPLSAATQAEVFSIAREALTNVRKHARAHDVSIDMRRASGEVVLRIKDDGVGFEADLMSRGRERWPHFGIAGMRERAESVGGRVSWRSQPGVGTEVELHVPVGGTTRHHALERSTPLHGTKRSASQHQAVRSSAPAASEAD
jgi:two-component system nitrate/nitrite sensor histidine kinase NarX